MLKVKRKLLKLVSNFLIFSALGSNLWKNLIQTKATNITIGKRNIPQNFEE
jgi:hypothetical protein